MSNQIDCGPLPKVVRCGPFTYRVSDKPIPWDEHGPDDKSAHWGYTNHERGWILIHPNTTCSMRRVVLLHELMHAAAFAAGQTDTRKRREEAWVSMAAPMLLDALQRSPGLATYLAIR